MRLSDRFSEHRGSALLGVYFVMASGLVLLNALSLRMMTHTTQTHTMLRSAQALQLAQAGVEQAREELYRFVKTNAAAATSGMAWFDELGDGSEDPAFVPFGGDNGRSHPVLFTSANLPQASRPTIAGSFRVEVVSAVAADGAADCAASATGCHIVVRSIGTVGGVNRAVQATIRYDLQAPDPFKYVYFLDNYGFFTGDATEHNIHIQGDLRSNGDLNLANINQGWSSINGDAYAAENPELGTAGTITVSGVNSLGAQDYLKYANSPYGYKFPPTDPVRLDNPNMHPTDRDDPSKGPFSGYKGSLGEHPAQEPIAMPTIGDLTQVAQEAQTYVRSSDGGVGARLRYWDIGPDKQVATADDREVTIIGSYGGTDDYYKVFDPGNSTVYNTSPQYPLNAPDGSTLGPDGIAGTPDDKALIISGRYDNCNHQGPLDCGWVDIEGPVVIPGDAIVNGGKYRGQGVLYAGRNIHIMRTLWYTDTMLPRYPVVTKCTSGGTVSYQARCIGNGAGETDANPIQSPAQTDMQGVEGWVDTRCR